MSAVQEYVLGLTAAATICGMVLCLTEKGPMEPLLKLICGLILTFCLVEPALNISLGDWAALGIDFQNQAQKAAEQGEEESKAGVRQIIKQETEAYIMDKARMLDLDIHVEVKLSPQALPVPDFVTIRGTVPPYGKSRLSLILTRELGIKKENQKWIS